MDFCIFMICSHQHFISLPMQPPEFAALYRTYLTEQLLPFWEQYAVDSRYGGLFEAVDAEGTTLSTDKNTVQQAQAIWAFAWSYHTLEPRPQWIQLARECFDFVLHHARDSKNQWYDRLDRRGTPLREAQDAQPLWYMALAAGQLFRATGEAEYVDWAQRLMASGSKLRERSAKKRLENTSSPRTLKSLDELTVLANALLLAENWMERKYYKASAQAVLGEIMGHFYDKRTGIVLNQVSPEGHFSDCPQGRLLIPGRIFETAGCLLDFADRNRDRRLLTQMLDLVALLTEAAWDSPHGGFLYKMDLKSLPVIAYDWAFKYDWVQLQAANTLLKAYLLSGKPAYWEAYERVHDYMWPRFFDSKTTETASICLRDGSPLQVHPIRPDTPLLGQVKALTTLANTLTTLAKQPSSPEASS